MQSLFDELNWLIFGVLDLVHLWARENNTTIQYFLPRTRPKIVISQITETSRRGKLFCTCEYAVQAIHESHEVSAALPFQAIGSKPENDAVCRDSLQVFCDHILDDGHSLDLTRGLRLGSDFQVREHARQSDGVGFERRQLIGISKPLCLRYRRSDHLPFVIDEFAQAI